MTAQQFAPDTRPRGTLIVDGNQIVSTNHDPITRVQSPVAPGRTGPDLGRGWDPAGDLRPTHIDIRVSHRPEIGARSLDHYTGLRAVAPDHDSLQQHIGVIEAWGPELANDKGLLANPVKPWDHGLAAPSRSAPFRV